MLRRFTIAGRIFFLILLMVLFSLAVGGVFTSALYRVGAQSLVEAKGVMDQGYERTMQFAVQSMATKLGDAVGKAKAAGLPPEETVRDEIHAVRFDGDGYYFIYDSNGVTVAHPLRPEFNGQERIGTKDPKGNEYIRALRDKARAGGGFTTYWFNRPGQTEPSPKLAYAEMIPGTDYWVSTGIYTDDIDAELARIDKSLGALVGSAITTVVVGVGAAFLLLVLPLTWAIMRSINAPLRAATGAAQQVAEGNLDVRISVAGRDEVSRLEAALELMVRTLARNIADIEEKSAEAERQAETARQAAQAAQAAQRQAEQAKSEGMVQAAQRLEGVVAGISTAMEELSGQAEEIRQGADMQKERIATTATAMEEMNATVREVAQNAGSAAEMGKDARNQAATGAGIVERSIQAMQTTQQQSQVLKQDMGELGRQAESIGAVITVIEDIADQTNLLALNAAIEAARAGEHGRGFAVVADEVRKLAEKTMQATKEVGQSIKSIQGVAASNIANMDKALEDLTQAAGLSTDSGQVLQAIVQSTETSATQIQSIATAAEEQSAATEEISRSIEEINAIAVGAARGVQATTAALRELAREAERLRNLIQELKNEGASA